MNPQSFVAKWRSSTVNERAFYQSHFNDLCALVGHPSPMEQDPHGTSFRFEAGASKSTGGQGFADVWYKDHFAWEYKGKHADLDGAYQQLLRYHDALDNPPLLIVSDGQTIIIRTKITNTPKREYVLTLDDLLRPEKLAILRAAFHNPLSLKAEQTTEEVTLGAARQFARIAQLLSRYGDDPQTVAHFLIRILFCLFSEDVGLLEGKIFTRMLRNSRTNTGAFTAQLKQLFQAMSTGGWFGADEIKHFDGHLFDDAQPLDLDSDSHDILLGVSGLDWSQIQPSIFGTLFERSLDPSKRAQLGAHYTSEEDILLIVEPVLMAPLRRRWEAVQEEARKLAAARDAASTTQTKNRHQNSLRDLLMGFAQELASIRVLDAACGSGNFLYVALRQLLDLWKEVSVLAAQLGLPYMSPLPGFAPHPAQLFGIELNEYAQQLAQATIWIGYIQWFVDNGYGFPPEPILSKLGNIERKDAILAFDEQGNPVEPEWPEAEVIIGNPPFLGDKKMRAELGDDYVETLRKLYQGRVPGGADLVTYWFEKARVMVEAGDVQRVGLLATQGIRGGQSRKVLDKIKETGDIFFAESDREWVLSGAMVHVSMIAFDNGTEQERILDGKKVGAIYANLSSITNTTLAKVISENKAVSFLGSCKGGPFDISEDQALDMLHRSGNPNRLPNSDLIRPVCNSQDLIKSPTNRWIIDTADLELSAASQYEAPFRVVVENVKPKRDINRDKWLRENWWRPQRMRHEMREAIKNLPRFLVTTTTSKHRLFIWLSHPTLPDHQLVVFARSDDYYFGILHSRIHELWALAQGTQLREKESGFRYTPTTCFETFPFPFVEDKQPSKLITDSPTEIRTSIDTLDEHHASVATAAKELNETREYWLKPPELVTERILEFPGSINGPWSRYVINPNKYGIGKVQYLRLEPRDAQSAAELKKRTLTNLYNQRPTWLDLAHKKLDAAVFAAYGWPGDLTEDEILERLLRLNLERA